MLRKNRVTKFETLEGRMMLSGGPTVSLNCKSGLLCITGAKCHDQIEVKGDGPGCVAVCLNGRECDFSRVKSININTKDGGDAVLIKDLEICGDLSVTTGSGCDEVLIVNCDGCTDIHGCVTICTGSGDDVVGIGVDFDQDPSAVTICRNVSINAGCGCDLVVVAGALPSNEEMATPQSQPADLIDDSATHIGGNLSIKTDGGNDAVVLVNVSVGGKLSVDTGSDVDVVIVAFTQVRCGVSICTGDGDDFVGIFGLEVGFFRDNVTPATDGGDQTYGGKWDCFCGQDCNIDTGCGDDVLVVTCDPCELVGAFGHFLDCHSRYFCCQTQGVLGDIGDQCAELPSPDVGLAARNAVFSLQSGCDFAKIDCLEVAKQLTVSLGAGDDRLCFGDDNYFCKAIFDGGCGKDTLAIESEWISDCRPNGCFEYNGASVTVKNFECLYTAD